MIFVFLSFYLFVFLSFYLQGAHPPARSGDDPSEGFQDHTPRGSGFDDCRRRVGAQGGDAGTFAWLLEENHYI